MIDFLNSSLKDGTLQSEDADSIEIASNCIAECFHVDPSDQTAMKDALAGQNLLSIYSVYEKLKGKSTASTQGPSSAQEGRPSTPSVPSPAQDSEAAKGGPTEESEKLKGQGNAAFQKKDYAAAIDFYTKALEVSPLNPIYLSNRAAAYSATQKHDLAKNDAELATVADPKYTKAWSRLGLTRFALGDAKGSMEAYAKGIEAEGNGGSEAMKKGYQTAKSRCEAEGTSTDDVASDPRSGPGGAGAGGMPDLSSLAGMLGGGGGAGGMPDLGSLMQNPMMRQMASQMMSNPDMMNNLMSRFGGGGAGAGAGAGGAGGAGGMPDLSAMMGKDLWNDFVFSRHILTCSQYVSFSGLNTSQARFSMSQRLRILPIPHFLSQNHRTTQLTNSRRTILPSPKWPGTSWAAWEARAVPVADSRPMHGFLNITITNLYNNEATKR